MSHACHAARRLVSSELGPLFKTVSAFLKECRYSRLDGFCSKHYFTDKGQVQLDYLAFNADESFERSSQGWIHLTSTERHYRQRTPSNNHPREGVLLSLAPWSVQRRALVLICTSLLYSYLGPNYTSLSSSHVVHLSILHHKSVVGIPIQQFSATSGRLPLETDIPTGKRTESRPGGLEIEALRLWRYTNPHVSDTYLMVTEESWSYIGRPCGFGTRSQGATALYQES
jgi:hypothetical protein